MPINLSTAPQQRRSMKDGSVSVRFGCCDAKIVIVRASRLLHELSEFGLELCDFDESMGVPSWCCWSKT
jgi:hypothetical protein